MANKTTGINLEVKNFEAAGKILAEIWSELIIHKDPVVATYTSPLEKDHDEFEFHKSEEWNAQHVCYLKYMLQIIKCPDSSCC